MSGWANFQKFAQKMSENVSSGIKDVSTGIKDAGLELNKAVESAAKNSTVLQEGMKVFDLDSIQRESQQAQAQAEMDDITKNIHYLEDNFAVMGFPISKDGEFTEKEYAEYFNGKHGNNYMIWNLSEKSYDYTPFSGQIIDYAFPGHPAPPLGMLLKICTSIESWLENDKDNVAIVHCMTGKGRTMTVAAAYFAWTGHYENSMEALQYACTKRKAEIEHMTIPTQRRYIHFFGNMLEGTKPRPGPLQLRRAIINTIPNMCEPGSQVKGCRPYIQIFKNGALLFTSAQDNGKEAEYNFYNVDEGTVSCSINCVLQGDILIRCKHLDLETGKTYSMFRAGFHTGYVPSGVLRLSAAQLDSASTDSRFSNDFFVDLIFADVTTKKNPSVEKVPMETYSAMNPEEESEYDALINETAEFWNEVTFRKGRRDTLRNMPKSKPEESHFGLSDDEEDDEVEIAGSTKNRKSKDDDLREQLEALSFSNQASNDTSNSTEVTEIPNALQDQNNEMNKSLGDVKPVESNHAMDYLDELEELEKELGLESLSSELRDMPVGLDNVSSTKDPEINHVEDSKGEAMTRIVDKDENLDELEDYLNTL